MASPSVTASPNLANPTTPPFPDDVQWVTAYLTIHMLSDPSRAYAYLVWVVILVALLLLVILHLTGSRRGFLGAYWNKWSLPRGTLWRSKREGNRSTHHLPSKAQILFVTVLVVATLLVSFIGPDYIAPRASIVQPSTSQTASTLVDRAASYDPSMFYQYQPQYTIQKAWWTVGGRTGLVAFALFPLCVLLAVKSPPFALLALPFTIQLHFDKLAWAHRWSGRFLWFITTLHVVTWSIQLASDHRETTGKMAYDYAWLYEKFIFGWMAYILMTLLVIFSIYPIRKSHYEAFYFLHVLLVPLTIIMSALHHPFVWWWCWAALAIWVGERAWRGTWWLSTNGFFGSTSTSIPEEKVPLHRADWADIRSHRPDGSDESSRADASETRLPAPIPSALTKSRPLPTASADDKALRGTLPHSAYPPPPRSPFHSAKSSLDRFLPATNMYKPPPGFAHAELLSGKTVRLRLTTPGYLPWAPGQHFLINIPSVSRFTSHPFTCASVCDEQAPGDEGREILILVRAKTGWTKDLWDDVIALQVRGQTHHQNEKLPPRIQLPKRGVLLKVFVDGPFGSAARARWGDNSTAVIITGGSGVCFGLAVLEYLCLCLSGRDGKQLGGRSGGWGKKGFKLRRIRFVWLVREFGHLQWCATAIRKCMALIPPPGLQVDIFVTHYDAPIPRGIAPIDLDQDDHLAPPTPQFVKSTRHRSSSVSSVDSDESTSSYVDLLDYGPSDREVGEADLGEMSVLDLTNFEGDDDTAMPGEALLNRTVKKEGKHRRRRSRKIRYSVDAKMELDRNGKRRSNRDSTSSTVRLLPPPTSRLSTATLDSFIEGLSPGVSPRTSFIHRPVSGGSFSIPGYPLAEERVGTPPTSRPSSPWADDARLSTLMPHVETGAFGEEVCLEVEEREMDDIAAIAEYARPGKPKLERILADEVESSKGSVVVACCGPTSLNCVVRNAVSSQIDPSRVRRGDMRGYVTLISEDFEY
ncbi:hypothetical protein JAAARDRAFT_31767 [Jaapia argillacea MUCL 33604]|uniref:ferric-chelate reductase (NADPH) n=1 Tax=Jaapia argillacea MUCL 33604 TaxID=933084 RepID=A0A067Q1C5_9AGAM|nr:hypothetical protein JAAARDRAFT_31767 [Jaapia argillacea MUCL 33604]